MVLLRREGLCISPSTVGRILTHLKRRGHLVEPQKVTISARRYRVHRPYAMPQPKDYVPPQPGDLVQLDTLDVCPLPGITLKQFTARDVVSRWDVLEVHSRATAQLVSRFLDTVQARMPFPIRAFQYMGDRNSMPTLNKPATSGNPPLRVPPKKPQTQRDGRTSPTNPYRGIL
jgi:putative transposase